MHFSVKAVIKSKDQFNTIVVLLEGEVEIQGDVDYHGKWFT